jgi:Reverse transcriptase (RNA-dependent DNA polymerase)/GIY-YIG catalytic domain
MQLVEEIKDLEIMDDELMVSFDVTALYPSIPVDIALEMMEEWIYGQHLHPHLAEDYINLAKLGMKHSFFQFNDTFYKQDFGTSMGNALSPFLANLFMSRLEKKLLGEGKIPTKWYRYVDDVFCIIQKNELENTLINLNSQYPSIKFTHETEVDGILPFLDLEIIRNNNKIEFGIYKKPTSTKRYITSDSFCNTQHKHAAFNSMTYRLVNLPLKPEKFNSELKIINEIAELNGYDKIIVNTLVKKHKKRAFKETITKLKPINEKPKRRISITYNAHIHNEINDIFKRQNLQVVNSNNNKIKCLLHSTKDPTPDLAKSGIYKITCKKCECFYIGQTKRAIKTRFSEHKNNAKKSECAKSAVAEHIITTPHHDTDDLEIKIVKQVNKPFLLDAYESIALQKDWRREGEKILNNNMGNVSDSILIKML